MIAARKNISESLTEIFYKKVGLDGFIPLQMMSIYCTLGVTGYGKIGGTTEFNFRPLRMKVFLFLK